MHDLNLKAGDPLALTLAADWRMDKVNYANDVTWEISLSGGEPEALAIQTTFGLRAAGMRLFPRFLHKDGTISEPSRFHQPPRVQEIDPNYARILFSPFSGVETTAEYRVASSSVMCGRLTFHNSSILKQHFKVEWVGIFNPLDAGQGMITSTEENQTVLEGGSGELLLIGILGAPSRPGSGPFASLSQDIELLPGGRMSFTWALAAAAKKEEAFQAAQAAVQARFDAGVARIRTCNESDKLEISTGNPDWDAALQLTQRAARMLFFPPGGGLLAPSFVLNRRPDQGASLRGDGSDYTSVWSGQTALDCYFISNLVLPGGLEWIKGLLHNFLHAQDSSGQIDWRLGLGGQRSKRMAQPVLASLALSAAEFCGESGWLKDIYPGLMRFVRQWFSKEHDQDGDGYPEWDHPLQTGLEDAPIYDRWFEGSQGLDLDILEAPGLAAMLVGECRSLARMGRLLGAEADIPWLEEQAARLSAELQNSWDKKRAIFRYQDHQTHASSKGKILFHIKGSSEIKVDQRFESPQRLIFRLRSADQNTRSAVIWVRGWLGDQPVEEELSPRRFSWVNGLGRATGRQLFTRLESIEEHGLLEEDKGWIGLPDYTLEDISLLVPLWAGIPSPDQARVMVLDSIMTNWLDRYGIPVCPKSKQLEGADKMASVQGPWNLLVGEGLLANGFRQQAAELIRRWMDGVVLNLRQSGDFRSPIHAGNGNALGGFGHLHGMAPIGLLLRTAGIHQLSSNRLIVEIGSPFSHSITVKYKGTGVMLSAKEVVVTSPSGQVVRVDEPGLHRIEWQ